MPASLTLLGVVKGTVGHTFYRAPRPPLEPLLNLLQLLLHFKSNKLRYKLLYALYYIT